MMNAHAPDFGQMIPAWVEGRLVQVEKLAVHRTGLRHLAVSVFVLRGETVLIQRRALNKYHTPGLWANACCTHPLWDEPDADCARRRLDQELGIRGLALRGAGRLEYRADLGNGMVENESVAVFVANAPPNLVLTPDPAEVAETRWISRADLGAQLRDAPQRFTPWLHIYMADHAARIFAGV